MSDESDAGSPPCFAHELVGGQPVDPATARDVARFRKAERARLLGLRRAMPVAEARAQAERVATALDGLVAPGRGEVVSVYWPIRGELGLRFWMERADAAGARIVLPVVTEKAAPLVFRRWRPGCRMERGVWNIPVPAGGEVLTPEVVVAPLVGIDAEGYRLGNGGGYYDRTLATFSPLPRRIGVGQDFCPLPTIFPMPWDIPMQLAVLGDGRVEHFADGARKQD
jgi:5-formyltetrahydrofolate cyclo-ligase